MTTNTENRNNQEDEAVTHQNTQNSKKWRQNFSFGIIALLVCAEFLCMKFNLPMPSTYLMICSRFMIDNMKLIGSSLWILMGKIGDFIKDSVGDFVISVYNIFHPFILMIFSPLFMVYGFLLELVKNYASSFAVVICLIVASLFIVYFQSVFTNNAKPLTIVNTLSEIMVRVYKRIGLFFADISSFFVMLNMEYYFQIVPQFITPIFNIVASPFNVILGYFAELRDQSTEKRHAIIFGSIILIGICIYGAYLTDVSSFLTEYFDLGKSKLSNLIEMMGVFFGLFLLL